MSVFDFYRICDDFDLCSDCEVDSENFHNSKQVFIILNHSIKYKPQAAISPSENLSQQQRSSLGQEDVSVNFSSISDVGDVSIANLR